VAAVGLKPVNGLKLYGTPDSGVGAFSEFHQLKPNGVCGVWNWASNGEPNCEPN